ncbi:MAG: flavin reductase family protein [Gemmatimonadetes bacterium]|nr:flavin reductase family protein [Gemmatimonadota bacterium]MDA1103782.1 flavin reductase family protein [Gemmatimonadota bacterium]
MNIRVIDPGEVSARERYQLMTSLVVPRPIGWLSTWSADGVANLAPFSYFNAISVSPMLVAVSIGHLRDGFKDTLVNLRARGAFCVNVVSEDLLVPMNESSANVGPEVDEFVLAGLSQSTSDRVDAPFVAECAAVLECRVQQEVDLRGAPNTLVIGEVVGIRLAEELHFEEGTMLVIPEQLRPLGRLGGSAYAIPGVVRRVPRPDAR